MKKIFKGMAILAATAAVGTGVAFASGCGGTDGEYIGHYCYDNYGQVYGMVVKVTVKDNIITKVEDVTATYKGDDGKGKITHTFMNYGKEVSIDNTQWHTVSAPWSEYFKKGYEAGNITITDPAKKAAWDNDKKLPDQSDCMAYGAPVSYAWNDEDVDKWNKLEAWLLQQYEGKSVADVKDIKVFINAKGEPYETDYNADFAGFDEGALVITGATQGSGRVILAVQNALK